jgi:hypothetical protein
MLPQKPSEKILGLGCYSTRVVHSAHLRLLAITFTLMSLSLPCLGQAPKATAGRDADAQRAPRREFDNPLGASLYRKLQQSRASDHAIAPNALDAATQQVKIMRARDTLKLQVAHLAVPSKSVQKMVNDFMGPIASATDNWQSLGPNDIGGRTRAILFDPQNADVMWAGSVSGGLWKWNKGWAIVPTFNSSLAVSCMVMDPSDSKTIYVGTGENLAGRQSSTGRADQGRRRQD